MSTEDKTIHNGMIFLHDGYNHTTDEEVVTCVVRKSRTKQLKCHHEWLPIAWSKQGHGKWRNGCALCGSTNTVVTEEYING
ncbi:MAG: hypothetical protein WC455_11530 [Dehalococcoidia bacterium]|jgi:hypothetical protein